MHLQRSRINISDRESDARFSSVKPYSEGLMRRCWNTATKWVLRVTAATMLLTCAGNFYSCSDTSQKPQPAQKVPEEEHKTVNKIAKTNENGTAIFNINGKNYQINVIDGDSGHSISDLLVLISVKDNVAFYITYDPTHSYYPRMGILKPENNNQKGDQGFSSDDFIVGNVVTYNKTSPCHNLTKKFMQYETTEDMQQLYAWQEEWLVWGAIAKTAEHPPFPPKNPLTENFKKEEPPVTLADLNNTLKHLLEFAASEALERDIEMAIPAYAAYLGVKLGAIDTGIIGLLMLVNDLCAMNETLDWAAYYKALCYEGSDTFEIWKLKGWPEIKHNFNEPGNFEVGFMDNSVFVILPTKKKEGPGEWLPPVAKIKGHLEVVDSNIFDSAVMGPTVELKQVSGQIQTIGYPTTFYNYVGKGNFFFAATTCDKYDHTYELTITEPHLTAFGKPSFTFEAATGQNYTVNFSLKENCAEYISENTGTNSFNVYCNGTLPQVQPPTADYCNWDYIEYCSKIKLKNIVKINFITSCLAIDQNGNIYLAGNNTVQAGTLGHLNPIDLFSLDKNSDVRWSIPFSYPGPITSSISKEGTIYTFDGVGTVYAIDQDGNIKWKAETTEIFLGGFITINSEGGPIVHSFSSVYSMSASGGFKWSYNSGINPLFAQLSDISVSKGITYFLQDYLVAVDATGKNLWGFTPYEPVNPPLNEFVTNGVSIASDDTIYTGSYRSLYAINSDGTLKWKFTDDTGIWPASSPSIDEDGNLYFGAKLTDKILDYRLYSVTPDGKLRWKSEVLSDKPSQPTITEDGTLYFYDSGSIQSWTADGKKNWKAKARGDVECPISIGNDGTTFIIETAIPDLSYLYEPDRIYVIEGNSPLANSPWPMFHHDHQNTGNTATKLK